MPQFPVHAPDGFRLDIGAYQGSVFLTRRAPIVTNPKGDAHEVLAQVLLPPVLMKVLAIKLKKFLKEFEDQHGEILIPPKIVHNENFSAMEDW